MPHTVRHHFVLTAWATIISHHRKYIQINKEFKAPPPLLIIIADTVYSS